MSPHQQIGGLVHLEDAVIDQSDGVSERTTRVNIVRDTYVFPVERRSGFYSSRL